MAVLPAFQGRGVAEGLLGAAEAELREHDCSRVTLDTTRPLERAIHFYTRRGYAHNGIVTDFFGMPLYEYEKQL
jgi:ribosomal protein S18 acetylase RimI-like enzyme